MSKLAELRQARAAKVGEMRSLVDKAERESRDLSADEQSRFESLKGEVATIEHRIQRHEALDELDRTAAPVAGAGETRARSYGEQLAENTEVRAFIQSGARGKIRGPCRKLVTFTPP